MKQELLKTLKRLRIHGPIDKRNGICAGIVHFCNNNPEFIQSYGLHIQTMQSIWVKWPKFSGDIQYPVAKENEYFNTKNLWAGKSGKLRRELLDFLISELEKELSQTA